MTPTRAYDNTEEQYLIGALLVDGRSDRARDVAYLSAVHFIDQRFGWIFEAIQADDATTT